MKRLGIFLMLCAAVSAAEFRAVGGKHIYAEARHLCGETFGEGWRLPEIWELFALRGKTGSYGSDKRYWSATAAGEARHVATVSRGSETFSDNRETPAFAFYLQDGDVTPTPKWVRANVLCTARTAVRQSDSGFEKTEEGVRDRRNDLLWEPLGDRERRRMKRTFEGAQAYCEAKEENGLSWRLPTLDELYGIVNYDHVKPSVDPALFGAMERRYYWSDDTFGASKAYVVGFAIGSVATSEKSNESFFRCVADLEE